MTQVEEGIEARGWLRGKGLSVEEAAFLTEQHRTTLSKKLKNPRSTHIVEWFEFIWKLKTKTEVEGVKS